MSSGKGVWFNPSAANSDGDSVLMISCTVRGFSITTTSPGRGVTSGTGVGSGVGVAVGGATGWDAPPAVEVEAAGAGVGVGVALVVKLYGPVVLQLP